MNKKDGVLKEFEGGWTENILEVAITQSELC